MGCPGSPETRRAQTTAVKKHHHPTGWWKEERGGKRRPWEAWRQAAAGIPSRRSTGDGAIMNASGTGQWDLTFQAAVAEFLRPGPGTPALVRHAAGAESNPRTADPAQSLLTLRQLLTEQGVAVLGLILQPMLIDPDRPSLPVLQAEPDAPTDEGAASADRAERSAIHLAFRARMAAARICLPKGALAEALRALHRERRACLQALQDRIAARRTMQAHERLARDFRRTTALTARGMPQRPAWETPDDTNARLRAAILNRLGE